MHSNAVRLKPIYRPYGVFSLNPDKKVPEFSANIDVMMDIC